MRPRCTTTLGCRADTLTAATTTAAATAATVERRSRLLRWAGHVAMVLLTVQTAAAHERVEVESIDGKLVVGELLDWNPQELTIGVRDPQAPEADGVRSVGVATSNCHIIRWLPERLSNWPDGGVTAAAPADETTTTTTATAPEAAVGTDPEPPGPKEGLAAADVGPTDAPVALSLPWPVRRTPTPASWIGLSHGDRLAAHVTGWRDEQLEAQWLGAPLHPLLQVPLESVSVVVTSAPTAPIQQRQLFDLVTRIPRGADTVALNTGERVTGTLEGWDGLLLNLTSPLGPVKLPTDRVHWIALDPELQAPPAIPAEVWIVHTVSGSRLTVTTLQPDAQRQLRMTLLLGGELVLPWVDLIRAERRSPRLVPLSTRTPTAVHYTPWLSTPARPPLQRDRSRDGGPLRVAGEEFAHGLGTTSQTEVVYALEPNDLWFRSIVGLAEQGQGRGSVLCQVLLDGEVAWQSPELWRDNPAVRVPPLDLTGRRELRLRIEYAQRGDVADDVDWGSAVLVRAP
jgi:hypothetical protein